MARHQRALVCDCGEHGFVPLTQGLVAFVDPEYVPVVAKHTWYAKAVGRTFYAHRSCHYCLGGTRRTITVRLHQVVLPLPSSLIVDHIDGDGLNDRASNLRPANEATNAMNRRKSIGATSRYRGVTRSGHSWSATIGIGGKQHYLGRFSSERAAAEAYDAASRQFHGVHGRPNFPALATPVTEPVEGLT